MSSATGLHVRKKSAIVATTNATTSAATGGTAGTASNLTGIAVPMASDIATEIDDDSVKGNRPFLTRLWSETSPGVKAVIFFFTFGVVLGSFITFHQHRRVILQIVSNPLAHAGAAMVHGRVGFRHHFYSGHPRTVTIVMPSVVNPKQRTRRLDSIFETWGPAARAVYVVHNASEFPQAAHHAVISENSKPEDPYAFPQLLLVPPNIGLDDGVPRLIHVIRTVFQRLNPDFAFFVNDHTFVIPEHLCKYLEHRHPSEDMYEGHALKNTKDVFNSGAAGYVLSRQTMKRLVRKWDEGNANCLATNAAKWFQGNPGLVTSKCLKDELQVEAVDTRYHGKFHRFHAFPLTRMVSGNVDEWYKNKHVDMDTLMTTADKSYDTLLKGVDCCSADTISFHYVEYVESRALFAVRQALLKNPHMDDHELKSLMLTKWPKDSKEIGGYSRGLPKENDSFEKDWEPLLQVMRKMSSRHTQREC